MREEKKKENNFIVKLIPVFFLLLTDRDEHARRKGEQDMIVSREKSQCKCDQFVYPKNDDEFFFFFINNIYRLRTRGEWSLWCV